MKKSMSLLRAIFICSIGAAGVPVISQRLFEPGSSLPSVWQYPFDMPHYLGILLLIGFGVLIWTGMQGFVHRAQWFYWVQSILNVPIIVFLGWVIGSSLTGLFPPSEVSTTHQMYLLVPSIVGNMSFLLLYGLYEEK